MEMKDAGKKLIFDNLLKQYINFGLPTEGIDEKTEFTVHDLKDNHHEFSYSSPVFKPNFFSFAFVKNAYGKYAAESARRKAS